MSEQMNVITSQIVAMAKNLNISDTDAGSLYETLQQTAFKDVKDNNDFAAMMVVANQYGLNPFTKEIYAFARGGKVTPIVSVDGWAKLINDNPNCDGVQFTQDDVSATCTIYRKDRAHPTIVTEWLDECKMDTAPWKKYPKRMLRHKALIQCARVAFGFSGIYDEDEAKRIAESSQPAKDVQSTDDGYSEFYDVMKPILLEAARSGTEDLSAKFLELTDKEKSTLNSAERELFKRYWSESSESLKELAQQADIERKQSEVIEDAEIIHGGDDEPATA